MTPPHPPSEPARPIGRGMLIAGWVLGLALLSLLFSGLLEQQRNPNRNLQSTIGEDGARELTLQRNRYGHYLASGTINGIEVEFLLDTGASDVSVPQAVAEKLGLKPGQALSYNTANGTITAYLTRISRLALGEIELHDIRASINPHVEGETILLGMSFLRHLEFTQRGDTLIIRQY
ncbi:MAG TPA: TIGR02281 family clan AA aspartic protease [Gammaproteobacteria bacterium]